MSLFKCRECWLTQCGTNEIFENSSFLMTSLTTEYDLLITGSQNGIIRIYSPNMERLEDGLFDGYKPTDLIIEKHLEKPILQIARGRLVSGNQVYHLAILHPRSVAVYSLIRRSGIVDPGNQNTLVLVYEHQLRRSAYNMVVNNFGGSKSRDFICVQSLDGQISFFEQENFAFSCFLPDFLLPGPLVYVNTTDSFVTVNSSLTCVSFQYKKLSEIGQTDSTNSAIPCRPDWNFLLGEDCTQIEVEKLSHNEVCLVILGQRSLHCLSQNGQLIFMKRFDFTPICFTTYFLGTVNKLMCLLISEISTLQIYENTTLRWSAKIFLDDCISVRRGEIKGIRGGIALLGSEGTLRICYLGTEPQLFTAPPLKNRELDFEKVDEELITLGRIIRNSRNNDVAVTNATTERELVVSLSVNPHLNGCPLEFTSYEDQQVAMLNIDILPNAPFTEVQVCVVVQPPLKAIPNLTYLENLEQRENIVVKIFEDISKGLQMETLKCQVVVSHVTRLGVPRVIVKNVELPLKLVAGICEPVKEAKYKITLNINQQVSNLGTLFPEFIGEPPFTQTSTSISFNRLGGQNFSPVTIILAKSSSRFRIQSDSLGSIGIIAQELTRRLQKTFLENTKDFKISANLSNITNDVVEIVEKHFGTYQNVSELQTAITEISTQYRMIQKRLIGKLKEKNPTSMENLEKLLSETHKETLECAEKLAMASKELKKVENELSAIFKLVNLLLDCSEISKKILENVKSVFVSPVLSTNDQSWEEVIEPSTTYLLKTILSKNEKDASKYSKSNGQLEGRSYVDINKFKKHLLQLFDRINKDTISGKIIEETYKNEDLETHFEENKEQLGSEIAKNTVRAKSAKVSTKSKLIKLEEDDGVIEHINVENVEKIDE